MRLIDDWKKAPRLLSVQAMLIAGAIQGAWPLIPDDLKSALPTNLVHWVSVALLAAGILGRLVSQTPPPDDPKP
jgi:hypothetical protein